MLKRGLFALTVLVAYFSLLVAPANAQTPLVIGALLPLTGDLASYGEASHAALLDAVRGINSKGLQQVELIVMDTQTNPGVARQRLEALADLGVKVVIGPYASSEVTAAKPVADTRGVVLISPLSTARTLVIPNDNVLRFTPDDEQEGKALAALAYADGIRVLVPVTRDDVGNQGLQSATKAFFEALGGRVIDGVTYPAGEVDFSAEAATIAAIVAREKAAGSAVGVYLTAFAEVTALFHATTDPVLTTVPWYGSDSVALSRDLVEDRVAAAFAVAAGYPNPILGLADEDKSL